MKQEIQQNGKAGNSAKLENWKFNKSGFITKTAKRESYEAALSGIQMSRRAGIQEMTVCPSGTLPQTFHKSGMATSVHSFR